MNKDQVISLLRQILLTLGGALVGKGYVDDATMTMIVGGIVAIVTGLWGLYTRREQGLIASAASQPGVRKIVASRSIADAIPNDKVVAAVSDERAI